MRIQSVEVFPLTSQRPPYDVGKPIPEGWWGYDQTLLRVQTDDGVVGWGCSGTRWELVQASLEVLKPHVIGENALEPDRVAEKLHQATFWYGRGGAITAFVGGLNIALWDILGQVCQQPVGRLLGGCYRDRVKPYASMLFTWPTDVMEKNLHEGLGKGFRAFKLGWGTFGRVDARRDEALVKAARQAVGDNVDIMVDAGGSDQYWHGDLKWAMEAAKMLAHYNVVWFEEALRADDLEGYRQLRAASPVHISAGEVITRRQNFYAWIEARALDILQPDLCIVGGLSEGRRIAWAADDHHILVVPHGWNTAVGLAADLHLTAAIPNARYVEYWFPAPYVDGILAKPFKLDSSGLLAIPTGPGLGIEVDEEKVRHHGRKR